MRVDLGRNMRKMGKVGSRDRTREDANEPRLPQRRRNDTGERAAAAFE